MKRSVMTIRCFRLLGCFIGEENGKTEIKKLNHRQAAHRIGCVYQDLEFITGMKGLMTHQLPNVMRAVEPWLKEHVQDQEYWDGEYRPELTGDHDLKPMNELEQKAMLERYGELPNPLAGKGVIVATV